MVSLSEKSPRTRIACAGAGGHAKVVADAALLSPSRFEIVGLLDDNPSLVGRSILGLPVLRQISIWRDLNIDALIPADVEDHATVVGVPARRLR